MPNYDDLREFFEKNEYLPKIAARCAEVPIVTGFTLDVDPVWAIIHDVGNGLIAGKTLESFRLQHFSILEFHSGPGWTGDLISVQPPQSNVLYGQYQGYRRRNLSYTDDLWEAIKRPTRERFGYDRPPVIMTVVHRPIRPPILETGGETDEQAQLGRLIDIINEARVHVRVEERPTAWFAFAAGDQISTSGGKTGILGGVLRDASGQKSYGSTCAHVAVQKDRVKDGSGKVLGKCVADTGLVPLSGTTVCDPIYLPPPQPYPGNGPSVNMLDCSLIELTATVSMAQLGGIAAHLSPGQDVVLNSAKNRVHCKLGSLALSYTISENNQDYCFRDVIELLPQPKWIGGTLGSVLTTTVPTQGDSGAWVLTDDAVPIWAGSFFAVDGRRGFAIRASWVHGWAQSTLGVSLTI